MNNYLFISDAAKEVKVESHVLRYWEEELHLPIKRNELGHRYYTQEDVERFKQIKGMKERGLQLKAIRMILRDGKLDMLPEEAQEVERAGERKEMVEQRLEEECCYDKTGSMGIEIIAEQPAESVFGQQTKGAVSADFKEDKARRLQWLLQEMIRQTIQETNRELCSEIKDSVVKELDYQFRMQEEREEAREQRLAERDEAYYKKMDELLRRKSRKGKRYDENEKAGKQKGDLSAESIIMEKGISEMMPVKTRERSAEAVEEVIREKSMKHKKRHFF